MFERRLSHHIKHICAQRMLTRKDVMALGRYAFLGSEISLKEANGLFFIHKTVTTYPLLWPLIFIESISEFIVHHRFPKGSVDDASALWLRQHILTDGYVARQTDFELLLHVLKKSKPVHPRLMELALQSVSASLRGEPGFWTDARTHPAGQIGFEDVDMLCRILRSNSGDQTTAGEGAIKAYEIEALLGLNDMTCDHTHHPAWTDLLVGMLIGFVITTIDDIIIQNTSRAEGETAHSDQSAAAELSSRVEWLARPGRVLPQLSQALNRLHTASTSHTLFSGGTVYAVFHRAAITPEERHVQDRMFWLIERLNKSADMGLNVRIFFAVLKAHCPPLYEYLRPFVRRAA